MADEDEYAIDDTPYPMTLAEFLPDLIRMTPEDGSWTNLTIRLRRDGAASVVIDYMKSSWPKQA